MRAYHGAEVLVEQGERIDFLTVTSHEKLGPEASIAVFKSAWNKLNTRVRRASPGYQYILVPERHQDGRLHAHLLETSGLTERWFKDNARQCGLGYQDKLRQVDGPPHAAFYVGKYLGKSLPVAVWPKGFRRVRVSRDWPKLPDLEKLAGWQFRPLDKMEPVSEAVDYYKTLDYHVVLAGSNSAWEYVNDGILPEN